MDLESFLKDKLRADSCEDWDRIGSWGERKQGDEGGDSALSI
jgi:hypothetical protein